MTDSMLGQLVRDVFTSIDPPASNGMIKGVAAKMRHALVKMHPAQLGVLLLEIQAAKEVRYPGPHPDYYTALQVLVEREPVRKPGPGGRFSGKDAHRMVGAFLAQLDILKLERQPE